MEGEGIQTRESINHEEAGFEKRGVTHSLGALFHHPEGVW